MAAVTDCSDFGAQENKICHFSIISPSIHYEVMGPDAMIFVFWMLSFKPTFSLSSFTFIKRLFTSSFSSIRVVSSTYLRLLIFLLAILILAWASVSPAFWMMYSAYKGFPHSSVGKESTCNAGDPQFDSWIRKIHWRRDRLPTPVFLGFPGCSAGKESACNAGDLGWISGLGRSTVEGKGYPLWYSGLENSMDCIVHGVTKSWTRLSDFHFHSACKLNKQGDNI